MLLQHLHYHILRPARREAVSKSGRWKGSGQKQVEPASLCLHIQNSPPSCPSAPPFSPLPLQILVLIPSFTQPIFKEGL